jgi:SAM-dependent methyltransferase
MPVSEPKGRYTKQALVEFEVWPEHLMLDNDLSFLVVFGILSQGVYMAISSIIEKYCDLPGGIRKPLWRMWHNFILKIDAESNLTLMNYGYAPTEGKLECLTLQAKDEAERYSIQLYDFVVSHESVKEKILLEVGCGRGGGASYITRYLGPKSYIGIDLSQNGIAFCNSYHKVRNLFFMVGDAMKIPFPDNQFDGVVNVESSRCYPDVPLFFREARRVLKPAGAFYFTDMRWKADYQKLISQIQDAGFVIEKQVEITANVAKALGIDSPRREKMMDGKIPKIFLTNFRQFAGVKGTERFDSFASGDMQYWSFLLRSNK